MSVRVLSFTFTTSVASDTLLNLRRETRRAFIKYIGDFYGGASCVEPCFIVDFITTNDMSYATRANVPNG